MTSVILLFLGGKNLVPVSFKERVKNIAISEAKNYKETYIDYEYLVCSEAFTQSDFYIINAKEENYLHLLGINVKISDTQSLGAVDFFNKCYDGTLVEDDFDFKKRGQAEGAVIGSVRRKINVLPNMMALFSSNIKVQEKFTKNAVICTFATSNNECTLGFIKTSKSYPKSLIKGNQLDSSKAKDVSLVLRKGIDKEKFNEIIIGDISTLKGYYEKIKDYIDDSLLPPKADDSGNAEVANDLDK